MEKTLQKIDRRVFLGAAGTALVSSIPAAAVARPAPVPAGPIIAPAVITGDPRAASSNASIINATLKDLAPSIVILPAGDIYVDAALEVPSARWLRGVSMGATRVIRTENSGQSSYENRALIRTTLNAEGGKISDMTLVAPKVLEKIQGVWLFGAKNFVVENVEALNCGYAFWAHEFAQYCVFRNVRSRNANVHFETTRAFDILFDGMESDDGDGDNMNGVEGVWHTLFGSKRITFRNGSHRGKGQPYLVVADSGDGDEGRIEDILFDRCHAHNTDGKTCLFVSKITPTASVGRIELANCNLIAPGIMGIIQVGDVRIVGGEWWTSSQEGVLAQSNTKLTVTNHRVGMTSAAHGYIYGGNGNAVLRVSGGRVEAMTDAIDLVRGNNVVVRNVEFIRPSKIYGPTGVGQVVRHVYLEDIPLPSGTASVGAGTTQPQLIFNMAPGAQYRIIFRGRMIKTSSVSTLRLYVDPSCQVTTSNSHGSTSFTLANNNVIRGFTRVELTNAAIGELVFFEMDLTVRNLTLRAFLPYFGTDGATIYAGAEVSIERVA